MTATETAIYDVIRTKRDARAYADTPIPMAALRRILQAGRMAGSAKHAEPVRFVVLHDPARKAELAACGDFTPHMTSAPLVIAVVLSPPEGQFEPLRAISFDAGRAAQNMMVTAWAEGITSCPTTMHRGADAARVLGLPEGHEVVWVLCFGYPAADGPARQRRSRRPLAEYVHAERWGDSLPLDQPQS